jgi:3-oxoacyl-[acyl-carrier protein] reductase
LTEIRYRVSFLALDVAERVACESGVAKAATALDHIDALIAGIWSSTQWQASQESEWDSILAMNPKGSFFMADAAATHTLPRKCGSIALTASEPVNVGGVGGGTAYGWRHRSVPVAGGNIGSFGIRVNAIYPGVDEARRL